MKTFNNDTTQQIKEADIVYHEWTALQDKSIDAATQQLADKKFRQLREMFPDSKSFNDYWSTKYHAVKRIYNQHDNDESITGKEA